MITRHVLAIDQGTTSSRAIVYDAAGAELGSAQQEFEQVFPRAGWVEHDPEAIWRSVLEVCRGAIERAGVEPASIGAIGITNQRETVIVWDRKSGRPIYNAIVWQDRRTAERCRRLAADGHLALVRERTGLTIDPYFSATKLAWLLDEVPRAREQAKAGRLAFGTVDSFLLWRLTAGRVHRTDATNASRTMLFDIHEQAWSRELLALLDIPESLLPEVCDCIAEFGETEPALLGAGVPVHGMAGDQQAALIGQACFERGMSKSTYGTGCFVITNTGGEVQASEHALLSTVAYRLAGEVTYGLEGSIFVAGSAVQWLRDGLGLIAHARDTEALARETGVVESVHVVPAFTGLGAPHWDPDARGAILGLTRDSSAAQIVTATLQAVAFQTRDLLEAMAEDGVTLDVLRVDGGMVRNDWLLQFLADLLGIAVERPEATESTAIGAANLAAAGAGIVPGLADTAARWRRETAFEPRMSADRRAALYEGWLAAVARVRSRARAGRE